MSWLTHPPLFCGKPRLTNEQLKAKQKRLLEKLAKDAAEKAERVAEEA
jgi:hypothetical protein